MLGLPFRRVYLLDTEFRQAGRDHLDLPDLPEPVCLVARELGSNQLIRLWQDELLGTKPPFPIDDETLFVAFSASAEWGVFLQLGWPMPTRIIDPYYEFLLETNDGRPRSKGTTTLLAALSGHGIPSITSEQKEAERSLVYRGGPWSDSERRRVLDYCQTDVDPLGALLERMLPSIRARPRGLEHAVIRGQYSVPEARMAHLGMPVDAELVELVDRYKQGVRHDLIERMDTHGFYRNDEFKHGLFEAHLHYNKMDWPRTATGRADLRDETLKDMCRRYPHLSGFRELHRTLSQLSGKSPFVGRDGRVRPWLNPFGTKTSRHNPSSTDFLPSRAPWMRGLIKPAERRSLVYLDWRSQEVFTAAVLSGDKQLLETVQRGDVYIDLAIAAGFVPPTATKQSHPREREMAKACFLAAGYGQQAEGMAVRTGLTVIEAENLLRSLRRLFPDFYEWSDHNIDVGQMYGYQTTMLGWTFQTAGAKANTIRNFPVQANAAEMCRLAVRNNVESGVDVVCPVHDAILIEADTSDFDDVVSVAKAAMNKASATILDGVEIDIEVERVVHWPNRFLPEKGAEMWGVVMDSLSRQTGLPRAQLEGRPEGG